MTLFLASSICTLLLVFAIKEAVSICRTSYVTFCDTLEDFYNYTGYEDFTEMVVGNSDWRVDQKLKKMSIGSIPTEKYENLHSLTLIRLFNDIEDYAFGFDTEKGELEHVSLYGNKLKRIRRRAFSEFSLRKLSLVNNSIEHIQLEAFFDCTIEVLDLSRNQLDLLEKSGFATLNGTRYLNLAHNQITFIEDDTFPDSLEILRLDHNQLSREEYYGVFQNLVELKELYLSHNLLEFMPNLTHLTKLKHLDVSYNLLQVLKFSDIDYLTTGDLLVLDLSNNRIYEASFLNSLKEIKKHQFGVNLKISLAFNYLTNLKFDNSTVYRYVTILLYGNPWNCKCWEKIEQYMKEEKFSRNTCDLALFNSGKIPYCIYQEENAKCDDFVEEKLLEVFLKNINREIRDEYRKLVFHPDCFNY